MPITTNIVSNGVRYDLKDSETAAALAAEVTARENADTQMQTDIDNINTSNSQWHIYNALTEGLVTDPADTSYTGAANTAALQAIIEKASAGDVIFFPDGRYHFANTIQLHKSLSIIGATRAELFYHGAGDFFELNYNLKNFNIKNLSIRGEPGKGRMIVFSGSELLVENCTIAYCDTGIMLYNATGARIHSCYFVDCNNKGVTIDSDTEHQDSGDHSIFACTFDSSSNNGDCIYLHNGGGLRVVSCKLLHQNIGVHVDFTGQSSDLIVADTSIENQNGWYVYCSASGSFTNIQIIGCQMMGTGDGMGFVDNVSNIICMGCIITTSGANKTGITSEQASCYAVSCALGGFETQYNNVQTNNPISI